MVDLLKDHGVTQLVDVRQFPRSRRNPPFTMERLARELQRRGITYLWQGETLGGLRAGGFRAYMKTSTFAAGLARLEHLADQQSTAIMCAEALPVQCHRRFIARQMAGRGYRVTHIVARGKPGYVEPLSTDTDPT